MSKSFMILPYSQTNPNPIIKLYPPRSANNSAQPRIDQINSTYSKQANKIVQNKIVPLTFGLSKINTPASIYQIVILPLMSPVYQRRPIAKNFENVMIVS